MKKVFMPVLIAVLCAALLCGCGAGSAEIDPEALAQELAEKVPFEDQLSLAPEAAAEKLYAIVDAERAFIYTGSGATAEEIAVFEFADEAGAKDGLALARQRIERQTEDYASYIPEELPRLENAVLRQSGRYLAVCVSAGAEAEEIIEAWLE